MGHVAHRYQGAEALEVTRLASGIVRAYSMIKQHHPELPFGGYYALGVCNDVNAMIELKAMAKWSNWPGVYRWTTGGTPNRTPGAF